LHTADNTQFCEQIWAELVSLGTKETLSCMARMMAVIDQKQGVNLEFDCDLGVVSIESKTLNNNGQDTEYER
jgi:hypothetical protein